MREVSALKRIGIFLCMLLVLASLALAGDGASPGKGKELFTGKKLGTNGKSCSMCHPGGKGLEKAAKYNDEELGSIINRCISNPLKGKTLDPASNEMRSLVMYIKSLTPTAQQ